VKKNLSGKVSDKTSIIIVTGLVFFIAIYIAYSIGKIYGLAQCALVITPAAKTSAPVKNPMRVPTFINPADVQYETRFNFTYDSVDVLRSYREQEKLDAVIAEAATTFEKTVKVMQWARNQWEPGRPDPYPPINAIRTLQEIRSGRTGGFCAQYNYVFVQAMQSFGITARYVTIRNHEVTEVWISELGKWVCFDPLFSAYYTNQAKLPLSVYEIYKSLKQNQPIVIQAQKPIKNTEIHLSQFKEFALWLKNNHVSSPMNFTDIEYFKVYFYEELSELNSRIILYRLTTTSIKDLYSVPLQH